MQNFVISGMHFEGSFLWIAAPEEGLVVICDPRTGAGEKKAVYPEAVWDLCPYEDGLWMVTGGGRLGRQLVFWSLTEGRELRAFPCPEGAGTGMTCFDGKLWVCHRRKRRLFCLDPQSGKVNWVIRTEHEIFSPTAYRNEFWLVECDPGPLGHWGRTQERKFFFARYDPARERMVERLQVPFVPACMAFDGERFWYAEVEKKGFSSTKKDFGKL